MTISARQRQRNNERINYLCVVELDNLCTQIATETPAAPGLDEPIGEVGEVILDTIRLEYVLGIIDIWA